jgi:hypothetical protein
VHVPTDEHGMKLDPLHLLGLPLPMLMLLWIGKSAVCNVLLGQNKLVLAAPGLSQVPICAPLRNTHACNICPYREHSLQLHIFVSIVRIT